MRTPAETAAVWRLPRMMRSVLLPVNLRNFLLPLMPPPRTVNSQLFITGGLLFVLVVIVLTVAGGPRSVPLGAQLSGSSSTSADMGACCPGPGAGQSCTVNFSEDDCSALAGAERFFIGYENQDPDSINNDCSTACNTTAASSSSSSPPADLAVTVACTCGAEYECVVTMANNGPGPAEDVRAQFDTDGNLTVQSPVPPLLGGLTLAVDSQAGTQVSWKWAPPVPPPPSSSNSSGSSQSSTVSSAPGTPPVLASGQSVTAKLQIIPGPMQTGSGFVKFEVASDTTDPNPSNSTITVNVSGAICPRVCGNSVLEFAEQCDDGNTVSTDGCSSKCAVELGYECHPPVPQMTAYTTAVTKVPPGPVPYPLCDCGPLPLGVSCAPPAP